MGICCIFWKETSKNAKFWVPCLFFSSFGCSFCHPMQEETFWESYLLRKVRQFTAQGCFEPYVVLIQFWKSFIPTPLHGNKESICDIFWKKTSKLLSFGFLACFFFEFWLQFLSSNARRDLLRVLFVEKGEAVNCPVFFWVLFCSYSILKVVYPDTAPLEQRE